MMYWLYLYILVGICNCLTSYAIYPVDNKVQKGVWGYCQKSTSHMGAPFKGGWYCSASKEKCDLAGAAYYDFCSSDSSADIRRKLEPFVPYTDSCHAGFFGKDVTNTSQMAVQPGVIPFTNNLCYRELIPGYSTLADGEKEKCACLAAAQCGAGSVCTYDCSCGFPCEGAAEQVSNTLQSMGELTFAGTFDFLGNNTDTSVACSIKWDTDKEYLVGYTVRFLPCHQSDWVVGGMQDEPTTKCKRERKKRTGPCEAYPQRPSAQNYLFQSWSCKIEGEFSCSPLKKGDTFVQNYVVDGSPSRFKLLSLIIVWTTIMLFTQFRTL